MSDSEAPPRERDDTDSVPPEGSEKSRRRRLEGVIPEIVRRAVELGVEKAQEAPDDLREMVKGLKLPKEVAHYLLQQIDDTKNGLFRVVAKEIRDFLEHTNFAGEVQKLLTTVQFEVNTTIRFTPNDGSPKKKTTKSQPPGASASGEIGAVEGDAEPQETVSGLPKPEVKTQVTVEKRKDRDRDG
ncbi:MAG: hypothetical protein KIT84_25245 [Labilithrix sp.]|nr:hypothetical protein [Labilithrix sp.]MCW5814358.1 hypothetical protein [Labilithrix sp.]